MYTIFFDTETCGVPKNYNAPASDINNWPRMVQIGWVVYEDRDFIGQHEFIIRPEGFEIPAQASAVHGITTEKARFEGVSLEVVMDYFHKWLKQSDTVVGHNVPFDLGIVGAEFHRTIGTNPLESKLSIDTMRSSVEFCAIPSPYKVGQYKWPKLNELYFKLFGEDMGHAHTALADIQNTAKCYFALVERGVIKLEGVK